MENKKRQSAEIELTPFERRARRRRRILRTLVIVVGILVIIRIALPFVAVRLINDKMSKLPDYVFHVDDIDLSLLTASITLKGIEMKKKNGKISVPFVKCNVVYVHIESFSKRASEIKVDSAWMNLVTGPTKELSQISLPQEWIQLLKEIPFKPNTIVVNTGEIHYREFHRKPNIDMVVTELKVDARNLENLEEIKDTLPSIATITALVEGAKLKSVIQLDQQKKKPVVTAITTLEPLQLSRANDLFRAYTDFDVEKGTISLYSNLKLDGNRFSGYGVPVIKNFVLFEAKNDKEKPVGKRILEAGIQGVANIFKKKDKEKQEDKISARVEVNGTIENPELNVWQILFSAWKKSMHQTIRSGLEHPERSPN